MYKTAKHERLMKVAELASAVRRMRRDLLIKAAAMPKTIPFHTDGSSTSYNDGVKKKENTSSTSTPQSTNKNTSTNAAPVAKQRVITPVPGQMVPRDVPAGMVRYPRTATAKHPQSAACYNAYKNVDFSKPGIYQIELPIVGGLGGARHTQTTAFLPAEMWSKLPPKERAKWRSAPHTLNGETKQVFFRTYSTSNSFGESPQSISNSSEGDYAIVNFLLQKNDAEQRIGNYFGYGKNRKLPITRYRENAKYPDGIEEYYTVETSKGTLKHVPGRPVEGNDGYDRVNGLAPTNIYALQLHEDRDNKNVYDTINDAMNAGEIISNIVADRRNYNLWSNNCHFGSTVANAWNPYLKPGTFSSGGPRGFKVDSYDKPRNLYNRSVSTFGRSVVPFDVKQRDPVLSTSERWALVERLRQQMQEAWEQREIESDGYIEGHRTNWFPY